jgi:DNA polymerase V
VESLEELREALATRVTEAAQKLRAQGLAASAVVVFLLTNPHKKDEPQYSPQAGRELAVPSSFTPDLIGECLRVLEVIYRPGFRYKKCGVLSLELVPDNEKQANLFRPVDPVREEKERRLMAAVDRLNLLHGRGTVRSAALGAGRKQEWQMRRDRKSPCYTTSRGRTAGDALGGRMYIFSTVWFHTAEW